MTRVANARYAKVSKAIDTAFEVFEQKQDLKYLLRFAAQQSSKILIAPMESEVHEAECRDDED